MSEGPNFLSSRLNSVKRWHGQQVRGKADHLAPQDQTRLPENQEEESLASRLSVTRGTGEPGAGFRFTPGLSPESRCWGLAFSKCTGSLQKSVWPCNQITWESGLQLGAGWPG